MQNMNLDYSLISYTKIKSKWIKHLNIIPEIIKCLEENIGGKFHDTVLGNDVLNLIPKAK